ELLVHPRVVGDDRHPVLREDEVELDALPPLREGVAERGAAVLRELGGAEAVGLDDGLRAGIEVPARRGGDGEGGDDPDVSQQAGRPPGGATFGRRMLPAGRVRGQAARGRASAYHRCGPAAEDALERMYDDLADGWPLLSAPAEYAAEAA